MTESALLFDEIATELYSLPVSQFTARRDELAKQARASGDRELAQHVKGLRRPSVVAWLANQLVRERPEEIDALLELGEGLREATALLQGDQLRELAQQQRQVLAAMVAQARTIAKAAGQPVSEDAAGGLDDTLRAALADPSSAEALASGRLTAGLTPPAFGGLAGPMLSVVRTRPDDRAGTAPKRDAGARAERLAKAREDARAAEEDADRSQVALRNAREAAEAADLDLRRADERVRSLTEQLQAASITREQADEAAHGANDARDEAERAARDAQERVEHARARLDALGEKRHPG